MYYTKYLPLLLMVLTGCTTVATPEPASRKPPAVDTLSASADKETELYRQAITALNGARLEQAESDLRTISKTRPEFAGPWINLALIDIKKNRLDSAQQNLTKALEKNPQMPQIFNALGFVEVSRGNINKAVGHYQRAITLKQDYAIAHYNFALLHDIYLQDIKTAVLHYKRYLELTNYQDKKTADWVLELERVLSRSTE